MKAQVLTAPAPIDTCPLAWRDRPAPRAGPGEVVLRVAACGLCRTDLHVCEGDLPRRREGVIPGHQIVGRVVALGPGVEHLRLGDRVGAAWLHATCGACAFCASGRENLCDQAAFTGWTVDGGFAEMALARAAFVYPLPEAFSDTQAAPLLCAGIIGFRALRLADLEARGGWSGARVGLYGFGAAGHVALQVARARGAEVFVLTRDVARHQVLARELGAVWTGPPDARPPAPLDAALIFAPAGELVPRALEALAKGGVCVLGGIHMSPTPPLAYRWLYEERVLRSVANNTRADGRDFLDEAARIPLRTHVECFPMTEANRALAVLKHRGLRGAGVLVPD